VLLVTPWFPHPGEAAGSFVEDQARAVAGRHEVVVLHLPDEAGRRMPDSVRGGVRILVAEPRIAVPPVLRPVAAAVRGAVVARRLVRSGFRPDIVHAHVFTGALAALPVARALGVPLVVSEHFSGLARSRLSAQARFSARVSLRAADIVCPVSQSLARAVSELAPGARVTVVPNAVDTELFHPPGAPRPAGPRRLLAVGSLVPVKGMHHLLAALAALATRRRDWQVEVVGDGVQRGELEASAERQGLSELVTFAGQLERPAVAERMRAADLLVVPSAWETFSVAAAEALCCGVPVVASNVGGLPDVVGRGDGVLVAPGRHDELATAIDAVLDGAGMDERAQTARRAASRFGFAAIAGAWDEVYASARAARAS
jgi:glycosyltransferase involved in cell wall biosynthesis